MIVHVLIRHEIDSPFEIIGVFESGTSAQAALKAAVEPAYLNALKWLRQEIANGVMTVRDDRSVEEHALEWVVHEYSITPCEVRS